MVSFYRMSMTEGSTFNRCMFVLFLRPSRPTHAYNPCMLVLLLGLLRPRKACCVPGKMTSDRSNFPQPQEWWCRAYSCSEQTQLDTWRIRPGTPCCFWPEMQLNNNENGNEISGVVLYLKINVRANKKMRSHATIRGMQHPYYLIPLLFENYY